MTTHLFILKNLLFYFIFHLFSVFYYLVPIIINIYFPDENVIRAAAKSLQPCPTLCDPIDSSPPGSPVPGILQARILEWVAISFSKAWKWKMKEVVQSCPTQQPPWTAACQAPPSMGFSRQEYWVG